MGTGAGGMVNSGMIGTGNTGKFGPAGAEGRGEGGRETTALALVVGFGVSTGSTEGTTGATTDN